MSLPDLEDLPLRTLCLIVFFAATGWAAVGLHTLAQLMEGELETTLKVIQAMIASLAAGILTFVGVYYLLEWPKMAAYIADFLAAFGGAKYVEDIRSLFVSLLQGLANRVKAGGKSDV